MRMNRREFTKYYRDYIYKVDLNNIDFKSYSYEELMEFLRINYYDNEFDKNVFWEPDGFTTPFGMYYLEFETYSYDVSFLLGLVDNLKGGKTIAFCMVYDDDYGFIDEVDNKVGYIFTVETNYFFRNKGVLNKAFNYIKDVFKNSDLLVVSPESLNGEKISIYEKIKSLFKEGPLVIDEDEYHELLVKKNRW